MKNQSVKWGMIGVGDVTRVKSAPSFNKIDDSRLVAVGSRTPEKAREYANRNHIPKYYPNPYDVITDPEVDIIYVATPPDSHLDYGIKCIEAGKPVYLEKPMARNYKECVTINKAAEKNGILVYVAFYRRSLDYFLKVREILQSGELGQIRTVHINQHFLPQPEDHQPHSLPWRVIPEISGGGYFHDMGCHALDIMFYLLGDPVRVCGVASNVGGLYEPEDTITALITFQEGIQMTGNWSFVVSEGNTQDRVYITAEKGNLSFSVFSFDPIQIVTGKKTSSFSPPRPEHIQMPFIQSIVGELTGKDNTCPSTGITAAVTSRVMDEILG